MPFLLYNEWEICFCSHDKKCFIMEPESELLFYWYCLHYCVMNKLRNQCCRYYEAWNLFPHKSSWIILTTLTQKFSLKKPSFFKTIWLKQSRSDMKQFICHFNFYLKFIVSIICSFFQIISSIIVNLLMWFCFLFFFKFDFNVNMFIFLIDLWISMKN